LQQTSGDAMRICSIDINRVGASIGVQKKKVVVVTCGQEHRRWESGSSPLAIVGGAGAGWHLLLP